MNKHSLDLLENAVDSLSEALVKYKEAENGNYKAYKFAILNISHFIELLFKYHISEQHNLLIYKNPFAQNLDKTKTISFWDAVNFISHETGEIGQNTEFRKDLDWLKKIRNDIEHYKFEMDVATAKATIGRIFKSLNEFLEFYSDIELKNYIPSDVTDTFKILSDEYEEQRHEAIKRADEAEDKAEKESLWFVRYYCPECDSPTMIPNDGSSTGFRCTLCKNEENGEILVTCDCCGTEDMMEEMSTWTTDYGDVEYRCYYCSGRYHADKDD